MSRSFKLVLSVVFLLGLAGGVIGFSLLMRQRDELASQRRELIRRTAAARAARARLDAATRELQATEAAAAAARSGSAALESSTAQLWSSRIQILKQLLAELPAQGIPEIKLLDALDWISVARNAELDTPGNLRAALAAARAVARQKFAKFLQDALKGFTDASGGELPADIQQLAAYLAAPADAAMLERYELTRTGRLGAKDETLIREKPVSDMILSVSLEGWGMVNGPNLLPAPGESEMEALKRAAGAMGAAVGQETMEKAQQFAQGLGELMAKAVPALAEQLGGESFEAGMKQAAQRFRTANANEALTNLGQLVPYLDDSEKFIAAIRPFFAQVDYMRDHEGKLPADPAQLRRYLGRPFNPQEALRSVKVDFSADGEHGSMSFGLGVK